jgi:cystathionine beta-lyase/cystathionine gamma-synthase
MAHRFDTRAIHAGYARTGNPTRSALEENLAALENARHGLAFSSGMAAIHAVLSLLRRGDQVISTQDLYGGAWRIFTKVFTRFGIDFTFVDTSNPPAIEAAIRPETTLLWLETPSNPLLRITDIARCSAINRGNQITTTVDNTFATPVLRQPLALGADVVVHRARPAGLLSDRARRRPRGDPRLHPAPAALDACREPRQREKPLLPSGHDDPRLGRAGGAAQRRHQRQPDPAVSAGLEDVRDLIDDLEQALARTAVSREDRVA